MPLTMSRSGGRGARWGRTDRAKEVEPEERGLAAMPCEENGWPGAGLDVLDDVPLQYIVGHAKRLAMRIEIARPEVVAVATGQIAQSAGRLHEDLEFARRSSHEF